MPQSPDRSILNSSPYLDRRSTSDSYSLMIHGGAGALEDLKYEASEATVRESITAILERGRERLERGDRALDVVEYRASLLSHFSHQFLRKILANLSFRIREISDFGYLMIVDHSEMFSPLQKR
jgi:Asparaginase